MCCIEGMARERDSRKEIFPFSFDAKSWNVAK